MKPANFAPVYACVYAQLAEVARHHGYALSIHGSLAADFDLVCIPWAKEASEPQAVVDQITREFAIKQVAGYEQKEHGRIATTISFSFGECRLDLSFMPKLMGMVVPTYTTHPGESLMGIANRQLRGTDRWEEIRDLNADKFPGMGPHDYYPPGTELKMPARLGSKAVSEGLLRRLRDLCEYWFTREDRRGMSKTEYDTWHALGFGSKAFQELRALLGEGKES